MSEHPSDESTDDAEFRVLLALRVRGFADADAVAESTGLASDVVAARLEQAAEHGAAKSRTGRINGYTLTSDGRERLVGLAQEATSDQQKSAIASAYDAFLNPNQDFKQMTTDRQTGASTDTEDVLRGIDEKLEPILADLESAAPRFGAYRPRFVRARDAFLDGDADALAKPMSGSYHDVWMELHEDLLVTLGREREDADG